MMMFTNRALIGAVIIVKTWQEHCTIESVIFLLLWLFFLFVFKFEKNFEFQKKNVNILINFQTFIIKIKTKHKLWHLNIVKGFLPGMNFCLFCSKQLLLPEVVG